MSNQTRIAVVTGANKGIGYAIVELLRTSFEGIIYLTARNEDMGLASLKKMLSTPVQGSQCKAVMFHQLDIDDIDSIKRFAKHIKDSHGGLNILINNAGIAYKTSDTTSFEIQASDTIRINYYGTYNLINELLPLIRANGRIVNVSSRVGLPSILKSQSLYKTTMNPDLTIEELNDIVETFIECAKNKTLDIHGFPNTAYGMSKLALTLITFCLQRMLDETRPADNILVVPCCPGYVYTDMSSHSGNKSPSEGADTPVYLAILPDSKVDEVKFRFVTERNATVFK